ncbi:MULTISPECIES: hypothetical protein [Prauserella salsuginis group]|uniref:Dolichyl-phosphate-mannose-protein mannosyltransferase n=2 Tax=Prauserella salsuginis group TaxID=2893672 RepID=A0A839XJ12_9PSEU|nr:MULTISPECIES: hypothetical protein [Prauserella salsuginis group]MBB3662517.1 hypothetical protein [Prauserella sediminis]MCR3720226.1 hypothetical protein [Prauserella flava]MCR3734065.1 hypothetical protein [Prauserella salsuginis]
MIATGVVVALWVGLAVLLVAVWHRLSDHRGWRLVTLAVTVVASLAHQLAYGTVPDEAHVGFRYARNIADGYGPVFNPGEPVEGYTDFAWIVLLALVRAITGAEVEPVAVTLGIVCALGCVLVAYVLTGRILRWSGRAPAFAVAAAVVTAATGALAAYGPSGLATPLFVLLVLTLVYTLVTGHIVLAGLVASLAVMTRLDGVVVAVVACVWLVIAAVRGRMPRPSPAVYVAGAAVLLVPWAAWRMTYYGDSVPTAVVARLVRASDSLVGRFEAGWTYVTDFALTYQAFLLVAAVTIGLLSYRRRLPGATYAWLLLALALAETAYAIAIGGGTLPAWELLAAVPVLLTVAAASGFALAGTPADGSAPAGGPNTTSEGAAPGGAGAGQVPTGRGVAVVAVVLAGLSLTLGMTRTLPAMQELRTVEDQLDEIGDWLGERLTGGTVVSAVPAGALAAAAGPQLYVVDPSGTTDAHLARNPGDHAYVVRDRMPAVVVDAAGGYLPSRTCRIRTEYAGPYEVVPFRRAGGEATGGRWVELYLHRPQADLLTERLTADPRFTAKPC